MPEGKPLALKDQKRIDLVFKKGQRIQNGLFSANYLKNFGENIADNRLSYLIVVPANKQKKSVDRNKIRRYIRIWLNDNKNYLSGVSIVIFLNKKVPAEFKTKKDLRTEIRKDLDSIKRSIMCKIS